MAKDQWIREKEDPPVPFQFLPSQECLTLRMQEKETPEGWVVCPSTSPCIVSKLPTIIIIIINQFTIVVT